MSSSHYDTEFFDFTGPGSDASARAIVPTVVELVRPQSVVDVGCGLGAWLRAFQEHGVSDVLGIDGDYVRREALVIDPAAFLAHDLAEPLRLDRRFDLAVSLEVAEHLDPDVAPTFIESLVGLAPVVLFSAAIPNQGGVDHRHERWQDYWAELFLGHGYQAIDCIRPRVWSDDDVEFWYAQNTLLYVAEDRLEGSDRLREERRRWSHLPLSVVHPRLYAEAVARDAVHDGADQPAAPAEVLVDADAAEGAAPARDPAATKLVMTLLVRNEADILEANLDYHFAQGVDFAIVTDHNSTDATPEILARYEARGLVHVIHARGDAYEQSELVTAMARMAATEYGADWVINNDADEFWWPQVGSLRDVLGAIPDLYAKVFVPRRNFRPIGTDDHGSFLERMTIREVRSHNLRGGPLEMKVAHRARPDITVEFGNHDVSPFLHCVPVPELIEIFHFPVRDFAQAERKVLQTGIGYELVEDRDPGVGVDQLRLLEIQRAGELRSWYATQVLQPAKVDDAIARGEVVRDTRLRHFMAELAGAPRRADAEQARAIVESALAHSVHEEALVQEVIHLEADVRRLEADVQGVLAVINTEREWLAAEKAHVIELQAEAGHAWHLYNELRASRALRYTRALRLLHYRVRDALGGRPAGGDDARPPLDP